MEDDIGTDIHEALLDFSNMKKKKKKPLNHDSIENSVYSAEELCNPELSVSQLHENYSDLGNENSDLEFSFGKKKRKKKVLFLAENEKSVDKECNKMAHLLDDLSLSDKCMADTDDYSYDYLLSRAFELMREKNPNLDEDTKKKLIMKPPQVFRIGTKKTSLANFLEICRILRRTPQHLQSFFLVELGTNGSIDSNGQLTIKGKFQQKQVENVLKRYIREYVTCHTCHSPDTVLLKEIRLCFLQCESCGSRCSVATIKSGFQAVVSKRAAIRAKIN